VTYLGLAYGPYSRARRPRPSEKIGFRVISGLSALVDPCWAGLAAKGRALHAREGKLRVGPLYFSQAFGFSRTALGVAICLGMPILYYPGAEIAPLRGNRPSRDPTVCLLRRSSHRSAILRRGGLCTPERKCMGGPKHVPPWATGFSPEEPVGRRRLGTGKVLSRECADQGSLGLLDIWLEAT
jgi:hypothetical protein